LIYHWLQACGFSPSLKRAKGKQKISKILQGVDLLIVGIPLFVNILRPKMRVLIPEGDNKRNLMKKKSFSWIVSVVSGDKQGFFNHFL